MFIIDSRIETEKVNLDEKNVVAENWSQVSNSPTSSQSASFHSIYIVFQIKDNSISKRSVERDVSIWLFDVQLFFAKCDKKDNLIESFAS